MAEAQDAGANAGSQSGIDTAATAELLAQLRDIRLPELSEAAVLADWAAGAMLGLLLVFALLVLTRGWLRRIPSHRHAALQALAASRDLEPGQRLLAQARLLQALASKLQPAARAGENKSHWSVILERHLRTDFFSAGAGAALCSGLYRPVGQADPDRLERDLRLLLRRVRS